MTLRDLLYEPGCTHCNHNHDKAKYGVCPGESRPPLARRLPDCVPPGLTWVDAQYLSGWRLHGSSMRPSRITDAQAELLFIGQAVKDGYEICRDGEYWECVYYREPDDPETAILANGPTAIDATAACMHRLADEKETGND